MLRKGQLDCKLIKTDKKYRPDFGIELTFESVGGESDLAGGDSSELRMTDSIGRQRSISQFAYRRVQSDHTMKHMAEQLITEEVAGKIADDETKKGAEGDAREEDESANTNTVTVTTDEIVLTAEEMTRTEEGV